MGRKCTVCEHPEVARINRLIAEGVSHSEIARRFGLGRKAVARHAKNHLPAAYRRVKAERAGRKRAQAGKEEEKSEIPQFGLVAWLERPKVGDFAEHTPGYEAVRKKLRRLALEFLRRRAEENELQENQGAG